MKKMTLDDAPAQRIFRAETLDAGTMDTFEIIGLLLFWIEDICLNHFILSY